ncbi:hypothetical protein JL721_5294 [Aureococcus anophagefferens]|nr:hypothetical protein JL721_5294 [Aureococcus anophagefferens]
MARPWGCLLVISLAGCASASLRIAALVTGHCDDDAHVCDERAWSSVAAHVFAPMASVAALDVFLCTSGTDAAWRAGVAAALAHNATLRRVDVYGAEPVGRDKYQQAQFYHRRDCYVRGPGPGADWYAQLRPDFVYFAPLFRGGWPFDGDRAVYGRIFTAATTCGPWAALGGWRLTAAHLSTGWWDPCRATINVNARTPFGVLRVSVDDQVAAAGARGARYFVAMVDEDRKTWFSSDVRHPMHRQVVPLDKSVAKGTPEGFYTWGLFRGQLDWRPLAVEGRLSRMVAGRACQTCSLSFPPETDAGLRSRACGCSMPRADAGRRSRRATLRAVVNLTTGEREAPPRVWSRTTGTGRQNTMWSGPSR